MTLRSPKSATAKSQDFGGPKRSRFGHRPPPCTLRRRDAQIPADLAVQRVGDFRLPRHRWPLAGLSHYKCRRPSRTKGQPRLRRCSSRSYRFTPECSLPRKHRSRPLEPPRHSSSALLRGHHDCPAGGAGSRSNAHGRPRGTVRMQLPSLDLPARRDGDPAATGKDFPKPRPLALQESDARRNPRPKAARWRAPWSRD